MKVLQAIFCFFNGLVSLLAAACVGVGAWALADGASFTKSFNDFAKEVSLESFDASDIKGAAILVVVVGSVIMLLAGIGCCGAQKDSKCLLGVFFISMLIICVLIIVAAVLISVYPKKLKDEMEEKFKTYFEDPSKADETLQKFVNSFQKSFVCCGLNGPSDYKTAARPVGCTDESVGCLKKIDQDLNDVQSPIFITAIVTLILLVLATAISGYLYCRAGSESV